MIGPLAPTPRATSSTGAAGRAGASLRLRDARAEDADRLLAWRTDPATLAASFDRTRPTPAAHAAWLARELVRSDRACWVLEVDGAAGGQLRFAIEACEATLGYALAPGCRGRGLAAPFVRLGLERLRAERPVVRAVIADVRSGNVASLRTFERIGFTLDTPDAASRADRPGVEFVRYRLTLGRARAPRPGKPPSGP